MQFQTNIIRLYAISAWLAIPIGCSDDPSANKPTDEPAQQSLPDPSEAIQKRIEGKTDEALAILRNLNEKHPASTEILTLLGRTLLDSEKYSLAAFRLEQAYDTGGIIETLAEAAEAHELASDDESAERLYGIYLTKRPEDTFATIKYARVLNRIGKQTEALKAYQRVPKMANAKDSLALARLFLSKEIYKQAEHWFKTAEKKDPKGSVDSYLGLIEVSIKLQDENSMESYALALEKTHPGTLDKSPHGDAVAQLLTRRRGLDFFRRGIPTEGKTASELAAALINTPEASEPVVGSSKLPPIVVSPPTVATTNLPAFEANASGFPEATETENTSKQPPSLIDIFSTPPTGFETTKRSFLEQAELSMVEKKYRSALLFTRRAIRDDAQNAAAWHLASQAHFLLGETEEAEMKALEATRHSPDDLGYHMDYLRIARETQESHRYLEELEKAHERFPESIEILWQLARRYHIAENKPVTAAVLYRKLLSLTQPDNPLRPEAERELRAMGQIP